MKLADKIVTRITQLEATELAPTNKRKVREIQQVIDTHFAEIAKDLEGEARTHIIRKYGRSSLHANEEMIRSHANFASQFIQDGKFQKYQDKLWDETGIDKPAK